MKEAMELQDKEFNPYLKIRIVREQKVLFERSFRQTQVSLGPSVEFDVPLPFLPPATPAMLIKPFSDGRIVMYQRGHQSELSVHQKQGVYHCGNLCIEFTQILPELSPSEKFYPTPSNQAAARLLPASNETFIAHRQQAIWSERLSRFHHLEVIVIWKGEIIESRLYRPNEIVSLGTGSEDLYIPWLEKSMALARVDVTGADCLIPTKNAAYIYQKSKETAERLHPSSRYRLAKRSGEQLKIDLRKDFCLLFKFVPSPRPLSRWMRREDNQSMAKMAAFSFLLHFLFLFMILHFAPDTSAPKIKNVPDKVARLLVMKPPKPPTPLPPEPKIQPTPQKMVKKEMPTLQKKIQKVTRRKYRPPQKIIVQKRAFTKTNRTQTAKASKTDHQPTDITKVGALSLLKSPSLKTQQPVSLDISQQAGGLKNRSNISSLVERKSSAQGRLPSSMRSGLSKSPSGRGIGQGTGYGLKGVKGMAGQRGVAGSIVGAPSLFAVTNDTQGLSQDQVMAVVKKHVVHIQRCYEKALLDQPQLAGRVEYEWLIQKSGQVSWVKVKSAQMTGADQLNECVGTVFKEMKFPVAKNGATTQSTIGFPFGRL